MARRRGASASHRRPELRASRRRNPAPHEKCIVANTSGSEAASRASAPPRRPRARPWRQRRAPRASTPSAREPPLRPGQRRRGGVSTTPGGSTSERRMRDRVAARRSSPCTARSASTAARARAGLSRGTYCAAISGTHTIRPPAARIRAASSPSWLTGQPSSQPPCSSSVARRHTPVKPLSTSTLLRRAAERRAADAQRRRQRQRDAPRPRARRPRRSCGPLTHDDVAARQPRDPAREVVARVPGVRVHPRDVLAARGAQPDVQRVRRAPRRVVEHAHPRVLGGDALERSPATAVGRPAVDRRGSRGRPGPPARASARAPAPGAAPR